MLKEFVKTNTNITVIELVVEMVEFTYSVQNYLKI